MYRKFGKPTFSSERQFREWFAPLLRQARKSFYLSQSELADLLGVRQADISFWENGKSTPSLFTFLVIEDLFGRPYFSRSRNIQDIE